MNDPMLFWSGFWSGVGVGLVTAFIIASGAFAVLVYLLSNAPEGSRP